MKSLKLDFNVEISATYKRSKLRTVSHKRVLWLLRNLENPQKGVFIGYRNLTNGYMDSDGEYTADATIKAALVVINERNNPIYVPLGHIKPIYTESESNLIRRIMKLKDLLSLSLVPFAAVQKGFTDDQ